MENREQIFYDIAIIGAGPAGLSAAIKLKQQNPNRSVAILEKGAEVGSHIISGAILDSNSLTELLPDWKTDKDCPVKLKVTRDSYYFLSKNRKYKILNFLKPKILENKNYYIISLGELCRYLAKKAEALGVEIFPSFAAQSLLYNSEDKVCGVQIGDFGLDKHNNKTANFMPGPQLYAQYVLVAEGARGSIAKQVIEKFKLNKNSVPQKYALGIKEIWQIDAKYHKLGLAEHFIGYPNKHKDLGGGFIYHTQDNKISIGFITYLNYKNPYTSPYTLFQNFKSHPAIKELLTNAKCLSYGARAINCGGFNSIPQLAFPGGAILGCSAGLLNSAKTKGIHNAISSGILCAKDIESGLHSYANNLKNNIIGKDLYKVRNFSTLWSRFGFIVAGLDLWIQQLFNINLFKNISDKQADYQKLLPAQNFNNNIDIAKQHANINENLMKANLIHEHNQPNHLCIKDIELQKNSELNKYGGTSMFYCPAAVYSWIKDNNNNDKYIINSQNCLHCKTCDIKDPNQNINWQCPQGASGPNYQEM